MNQLESLCMMPFPPSQHPNQAKSPITHLASIFIDRGGIIFFQIGTGKDFLGILVACAREIELWNVSENILPGLFGASLHDVGIFDELLDGTFGRHCVKLILFCVTGK